MEKHTIFKDKLCKTFRKAEELLFKITLGEGEKKTTIKPDSLYAKQRNVGDLRLLHSSISKHSKSVMYKTQMARNPVSVSCNWLENTATKLNQLRDRDIINQCYTETLLKLCVASLNSADIILSLQ